MQYSFWLIKETIIVVFVACIHLQYIDGHRNDCETPDGREGLWVVKKYCRVAKIHPLEADDNDSIYCCPKPTTHRSAQPPLFPVSEPRDTRNAPKNILNVSRNHTSVTSDVPRGNQRPVYGHANPRTDSSSSIPTDSHKVPSDANSDTRRTVTSHYNPEERPNIRNKDLPKSVPNLPQDNDHRSVKRDSPNDNRRPVYDHDISGRDSLPNIPTDSHKVPSNANSGNRRTVTSHYNPEERHNTRNNALPKSVPNVPQDNDRRDFPSGNRRPYDHENPGRDSLSNIPTDPNKELSSSSSGNHPTVTSYHNTNDPQDRRNNEFPKSAPNPTQDNDHRSVYNDNQGQGYGHPSPGRESSPNIPAGSHAVQSSSSRGSHRPEAPRHSPEEDFQPDVKENKKWNINSGQPVDPSEGGNVRFENPEHSFYDQGNRNRRLKPPSSNSNAKPTVDHSSDKDSSNKRNSAGPDSARNNPKPVPPTVGHYPSRHQFDVQNLPSNPKRLKPSHNDAKNDTFDENIRHTLYPNSQPKVPACGVKPYDLFIAGGETSEAHQWPWMTSIFQRAQGFRPKTFLCGGSLINNKYVLTAAHCFINNRVVLPASSFVVRLGSHFLDSGEEYAVGDILIHPEHNDTNFFNDIALVKISSQVYITDKIAPICLPTTDMMSYDFVDRMATVAGWGDVAFRTGSSRALQHVKIPIVSSEECFAAYSRVRGAAFLAKGSDHIICAGLREGGKDACLGDSGGPLMLKTVDDRWIIVGIVSLGYKCAEPGYPGVYTRVTHYLTWIDANVKPH